MSNKFDEANLLAISGERSWIGKISLTVDNLLSLWTHDKRDINVENQGY